MPRKNLSASETKNMWVEYYDSLEGEENRTAFRQEHERFTRIHSWDNSIRVILEKAHVDDGDTVLDAGCGWGRMIIGLVQERKDLRIEAVDISAPALEIGRDLLASVSHQNTINWHEADLESLPFADNYFDSAYSARVLQHVSDAPRAVSEIMRVLKPGGTFALFLQNKLNPLNLNYYSNTFTPGQVREWFSQSAPPSSLRVSSMDFFPNSLGFLPKSSRLSLERLAESTPLLNRLGGKVLAFGSR